MNTLKKTLLLVTLTALVATGCKKDDNDPPPVNNNNNNNTECPDGMTGSDCETELRAQYMGEYEGEHVITDQDDQTTTQPAVVNITASAEGVDKIEITSIISGQESSLTATVNEDGFVLSETSETTSSSETDYVTVTSSGYGGLDDNTLIIHRDENIFAVFGEQEFNFDLTYVTTAEKQ